MSDEKTTTVGLVSLGCPKNLVDSEKMLGSLAEAGCVVTTDIEDVDVVVVNTCGFLAAARDESMAAIDQALALKAAGRVRRVVVAGCLAQRDGDDMRKAAPGVDAIVGVNNRDDLARAVIADGPLTAVAAYRQRAAEPGRPTVGDDTGRLRLTPRHTAYLRISEGCSHGCTFCTIPAIRGPFRSKPIGQLLDEAAELIADGAVELNLIGQDTTGYGADIGYTAGLAGLLRELDDLDGLEWIRLLYAYPTGVSDDVIAAMAECESVVPYLDVPLQHIADPVLHRMRRRITRRQTEDLLRRLRDGVGDLTLRTTFIVGFPGETDEDFAELLRFVQTFGFDAMGVFAYSREAGTPAAKLDGQVPPEVAAARVDALMRAQQELVFAANRRRVGEIVTVLVDGVDTDGRCVGRSAGQAPEVDGLCYLTDPRPAGCFVSGSVVGFDGYDLIVEPPRRRRRKRASRRLRRPAE